MELSRRVKAIKPSPTLSVSARASRLKAQGRDIINLSAGEPDFDTPDHIKKAAIRAIRSGFTKYTAVDGIPSLKQAIVNKLKRDNQLRYIPEQILVSCGGKQSFFNLALATINPKDEVIIPAPYWVSYPDIVLIAGGQPVIVEAGIRQHFKITASQLSKALTPRTRLVVINSPSNPSGAVYSQAELGKLGEVLRKHHQVLVATDDIYEHILFEDKPFVNILNVCPDLYPRTIVVNGVSKTYSMTGWRIGYAAGPGPVIAAMMNIQSQSTSNPTSISQVAAEAALNGKPDCIKAMVDAFRERHQFIVKSLNQLPGVHCLPSGGAFYAFPDMREAIKKLHRRKQLSKPCDVEFCEYLLEQAGVAAVPGSAFGLAGYIRISFATSMNNLKRAAQRLQNVLN